MKKIIGVLTFFAAVVLVFSSISYNADAKNANFMRTIAKKQQVEYDYTMKSLHFPHYNKKNNQTNWEIWLNGFGALTEKQTSKGYYDTDATNYVNAPALKLPVKKNSTWKVGKEQRKIVATKTTVKTKYKVFKNAVKVQIGKSSAKHYQYFAPKYGEVKETKKGKVAEELVKIVKY